MQYWWLIALSVSAGIAGQTVLKLGVTQPDTATPVSGLLPLLAMIIQSPLVLLGLCLYGIGALAWIAVLSRLDLSYAYPFLALNFVLIAVIARLLLGETIPTLRWLGLGLICVGIILSAQNTH